MNSAKVVATIVPGHRVASGQNGNPRFPGGTLKMQLPHFAALGLDLSGYYLGTVNVSIAPAKYRVVEPRQTFRAVKWHPTEPAEDFSFFDVGVDWPGGGPERGLIYFPHPETKPEHFQDESVLELLLPWTPELTYGQVINLRVPTEQMIFDQ